MISYISIYTSDVKKDYSCMKMFESKSRKPPLYGKDLEILIPWADWNNYTNILFQLSENLGLLKLKSIYGRQIRN